MSRSFPPVLLACLAPAALAQEVDVRRLPEGAAAPDVAVHDGAAHVVYGRGGDAYLEVWRGDERSDPLRVNDREGDVLAAGERGPRVAVGPDGAVHVVWSPPRLLGLRYARRPPGAAAFESARDLLYEGAAAAEGAELAVAGERVLVVWLDGAAGEPAGSPVGLPLFGRLSRDGGATFGGAGPLPHDYGGGACACCHLSVTADADGRFLIGFRGARDSLRDPFLLRSDARGRRFEVARVAEEGWRFRGCPMDGPAVRAAPAGEVLVAYAVEGRVAWTRGRGARFASPRRPAPDDAGKYAVAVPGGEEVLFAWLAPGGRLRWEVHGTEGAALRSGDAAARPGSRFTAFAAPGGGFVIVD